MSQPTIFIPYAFRRPFQDPQSRSDIPAGANTAAPATGDAQAGGLQAGGPQAAGPLPGATTNPANPQQADKQQGACGGEIMWMMPVFLGLMYFMMWRPEQKRRKQQQALLASIKQGDHVVTVSGMHGTVSSLTDKTVTLRIDTIDMTFDRSAVGRIERDDTSASTDK